MASCTILLCHLAGILNNELGRQFSTFSLASALKTGVTLALFHDTDTFPVWKDKLESRVQGYDSSYFFRTLAVIPSTPVDSVVKFSQDVVNLISGYRNLHQQIRLYYITRELHATRCYFRQDSAEDFIKQICFLSLITGKLAYTRVCDTSGSLFDFDLIERKDQYFSRLLFNLSARLQIFTIIGRNEFLSFFPQELEFGGKFY